MAIHCYNMIKEGNPNIIVGRDDGVVEIYMVEDHKEEPTLRKTHVETFTLSLNSTFG